MGGAWCEGVSAYVNASQLGPREERAFLRHALDPEVVPLESSGRLWRASDLHKVLTCWGSPPTVGRLTNTWP